MAAFRILLLAVLTISLSCKTKPEKKKNISEEEQYTVYSYKVEGVNDSLIADSVWKIVFSLPGIEELVIDKEELLVTVKADVSLIKEDRIKQEIEKRGGNIVKEVH